MMPVPYNELSDIELTAMIRQDDHGAYRELYYRYTDVLYTHAYTRLNDREEAKDVVQEIFSTLWSNESLRGLCLFQLCTVVFTPLDHFIHHRL